MLSSTLRAAIERILGDVWKGDVAVAAIGAVGLAERTHVHRLRIVAAPQGAPPTVILKLPRLPEGETFDVASDRPAVHRFFNEWTCLEFLANVCPVSPAPRLYGADRELGLLVLEDLGSGESLDQALTSTDRDRAARLLIGLMRSLGHMHADTFGRQARFDELLRERETTFAADAGEPRRRRMAAFEAALRNLNVSPPDRFDDEFAEIVERTESAELAVLVHGDPCPDNCQFDGERMRILDFEHGRFDDAFVDGCYPRIHFPTCWCTSRLPDDVAGEAEAAYRGELARSVPAARDDERFERAMVDASVLWAWTTFAGWHMPSVLEHDHQWGLVTVRQRVLFRLGLILEMLERGGWYPAIARATRSVRDLLAQRWRDVNAMPFYEAFR